MSTLESDRIATLWLVRDSLLAQKMKLSVALHGVTTLSGSVGVRTLLRMLCSVAVNTLITATSWRLAKQN